MNDKLEPREIRQFECDRQLCVVRFSPCGNFLVAGGYDASIRRWDLREEADQEMDRLDGHHGWLQWLEFQPGGDLLFSVDSWGQLRATRFEDDEPTLAWNHAQAHDGWIRSLTLSACGGRVITGGRDRVARIWSASDGERLFESSMHSDEVYAAALHPDGKTLVTGDLFGNLRCWEVASGKCIEERRIEKMHLYERIQDVGGLRLLRFHDADTLICAGAEPQRAGRSIAIPTIHWIDWPSLDIRSTRQFGPDKQGFVFDLVNHPQGFWAAVTSGQPGNGQFLLLGAEEPEPFFATTKLFNCHSIDVDSSGRLAVVSTNRRSQGNGAVKDKDGNYLGNFSLVHLYEVSGNDGGS